MNISVLVFVVIAQIIVFQFVAVAFTRSLFTAVLGPMPDWPAGEPAAYLRSSGRRRFVFGSVLLAMAVAGLVGLQANMEARKVLLAVLSLISAGAFVYAFLRDRRALRMMRDAFPDAGVRYASLRPRTISQWYHPIWELIPIGILVATVVLTAYLGRRGGLIQTRIWVLQALQAAIVIGALVFTYRQGIAVPQVSRRFAMLRDRPKEALEFGERLAAREMQYFMSAKIGVALLLGVSAVGVALKTLAPTVALVLDITEWVLIGLLLALFAAFMWQVVALTRRVQNSTSPTHISSTASGHE